MGMIAKFGGLFRRMASSRSNRKKRIRERAFRSQTDEGTQRSRDLIKNPIPTEGHGRVTGG